MATKKLIKEFVQCIQRHDYPQAATLLAETPELATATCTSPPKKYDGQSLLQIAVRNGAVPIVEDLIKAGADVNFMEKSAVNEWNSPVLHDAVNVAAWSTLEQDPEQIEKLIGVVRLLLEKGAATNRKDSDGITPLRRFLGAARERVQNVYFDGPYHTRNDRLKHLRQIHDLLLEYGATPKYVEKDGHEILSATDRERIGLD